MIQMAIYNERQINFIRESCKILHRVMEHLRTVVREGVTTGEIDSIAEKMILESDAEPAFKGVRGNPDYPATCCISINEEIVHGIPGKRKLESGDIVSIDCGARYKGYYSDAAFTFSVGDVGETALNLMKATSDALLAGSEKAIPGNRIGDISAAIQNTAEGQGFSVVRHLYGHGLGANLHEEPAIFNFGNPGTGMELKPGMVIAIETMVCEKDYRIVTLDDGWTVVTADGGLSAHYEDSFLITENGNENLTRINIEGIPLLRI
jgi:methionyl aminopeptidase